MSARYPCVVDLERPDRFERSHVFLRLLAFLALGIMGLPLSAVLCLIYLLLPLIAAAEIAARSDRYLTEFAPRIVNGLQFVIDGLAYAMLLTDQIPRFRTGFVEFSVSLEGEPSVSSALFRVLYALPEAFVIAVLSVPAVLLWMIAAVSVLLTRTYPQPIFAFQRGMLRWVARLFTYLGSLVDRYPPFAVELGHEPEALHS